MIWLIVAWFWGVRLFVLLGLTLFFYAVDPKHDIESSMVAAAFVGWCGTFLMPFFRTRQEAHE